MSGSDVRAVIFDMDGVLLDSEPIHFDALNDMLAGYGYRLMPEENQYLLGTTVKGSFRWLAQRFELADPLQTYIDQYHDKVLVRLQGTLEPAVGLHDLLSDLRARHVATALASSSPRTWIAATLQSLGVGDYFSVVVSGDDVGKSKPEPDIYIRAAELLGIEPNHCLVVEDSPAGMLAGKRAGMAVVGVRTPYTAHLDLTAADLLVGSLEEVDIRDVVVAHNGSESSAAD